jgi:succinyl-diaminopimelate desuccinylase
MDRLDEILKGYEEEMVKTLQELVRIPSVDGEPKEGMPFGENCARALDYALKKAESFGFETRNDENYAGHAALGNGKRTLGILAHLDVVPEGDDWTVPPYEALLKDGFLYGRGSTDNKNSCVSCLYALRAIKEAGIPLKDRVLLIMGCNEEKGSADMVHYMAHVGMPDYGFSPDSGFPVCYAEKGIHRVELSAPFAGETPLVSLAAGQAVNIVPNRCKATLRGTSADAEKLRARAEETSAPCKIALADGLISLEVEGVASHAASPSGGRNAICLMLEILASVDLGGAEKPLSLLRERLGLDAWDGAGLNIQMADEPSGPLTVNLGILRADANGMTAQLDIRQPVTASFDDVRSRIAASCAPYGVAAKSIHISEPLYMEKDSWLVTTLMKVYKEITGRDDEPFSMGGGTYARSMKNAVAFGPSLPDSRSAGCHGPDERLYIPELFTAARLYAHTIVALAGEKDA